MRTFKQHIKEAHYEGDAQGVGTMDQNSIEDSVIGAFNVENPEVLKKVNALYGAIQQVDRLLTKLNDGNKEMPAEKEAALNIATS